MLFGVHVKATEVPRHVFLIFSSITEYSPTAIAL